MIDCGTCKTCGHECHCSNGSSCCGGECECKNCECQQVTETKDVQFEFDFNLTEH